MAIPGLAMPVIPWASVMYYTQLIFWVLVFAGIFYYCWYFMTYRYRVIIFDKRSRDYKIGIDRGKVVTDKKDGSKKLRLYLSKKSPSMVDYKYIKQTSWGFLRLGTIVLERYSDESFTFVDVAERLSENDSKLDLIPIEADAAESTRTMSELRRKYENPSWLERYGAITMTLIVFLILVGSLLYGINQNKKMNDNNMQVTSAVAQSLDKLALILRPDLAPNEQPPADNNGKKDVTQGTFGLGII